MLIVAGVLCAVLLLYLASIGPACVAENRGYISQRTVDTAYAPIIWLGEKSDIVGSVWNWWVGLWVSP